MSIEHSAGGRWRGAGGAVRCGAVRCGAVRCGRRAAAGRVARQRRLSAVARVRPARATLEPTRPRGHAATTPHLRGLPHAPAAAGIASSGTTPRSLLDLSRAGEALRVRIVLTARTSKQEMRSNRSQRRIPAIVTLVWSRIYICSNASYAIHSFTFLPRMPFHDFQCLTFSSPGGIPRRGLRGLGGGGAGGFAEESTAAAGYVTRYFIMHLRGSSGLRRHVCPSAASRPCAPHPRPVAVLS
ncbi:unnamed protein product, partial [Iphiclides podalirius]